MKNNLKILFINKFLYPKGGSETYVFKLASYLEKKGHKVEYFGMEHADNIVSNSLGLGVKNLEFRGWSINKLLYPFKIIYSFEAKNKIREVIKAIKPDVIHLNNYNFQITPSILYEIKNYDIPVVMTLHDFQLVCPNHMMYLEHHKKICEQCKGRKYLNCVKNKCIHNSAIKSVFAAIEGFSYYKLKTYDKYIDYYIAPSEFMKNKVVEFGEKEERVKIIHNFVNELVSQENEKNNKYVLYFGRLSIQKGIDTLIEACKRLPEVNFVIAGEGDLAHKLQGIKNINYVGHKSGDELKKLTSSALFSICPSQWYENCPMSILESQMYGTPVIGARIGGIPELIEEGKDGFIYNAEDVNELVNKIKTLYNDDVLLKKFSNTCKKKAQEKYSMSMYYEELMNIYDLAIQKHESRGRKKCQEELYTVQ